MEKTRNTVDAVGYIRMSTDQQADSPERQRAEVEDLAQREGFRITRWYEDHGQTGTESANRPEFQKLLRDAQAGRFEAILVYEQSRLSREDVLDAMMHWRILKNAGVRVVTVQRGEIRFDDLGDLITTIVGQHGAHDESVKISQRSSSGKRRKVLAGEWAFGPVFGFDREIVDDRGKVVRTVSFRERFRKPPTWSSRPVPSSEVAAVDAVRWAFTSLTDDGISMGRIARGLNERGVKTRYDRRWTTKSVRDLLTNPIYAGVLRVGANARGKFSTIMDRGEVFERDAAFEGLISPQQFADAQEIIDSRSFTCTRRETYLLTGLLWCAHCGERITCGVNEQRNGTLRRWYKCNVRPHEPEVTCLHPSYSADRVEAFVLGLAVQHVLCDENVEQLRAAARLLEDDSAPPSPEVRQLADLRRKIERATENLALAEADDFQSISGLIAGWREDERTLLKRVAAQQAGYEPRSEVLDAIADLARVRENLHLAPPAVLASAIRSLVARITLGREKYESGYYECFGQLQFTPEALNGKQFPIVHADVAEDHRYRQVHRLLLEQGPTRYREIRLTTGWDDSTLWQALTRGERFEVLHRPQKGLWVARRRPQA